MFPASAPSIYQSPKCFVTYGTMCHLDIKQAPRKAKPWTAVMSLDFIHKVDLILPSEVYDAASEKLGGVQKSPNCSKVVMSLGDILQGDFFTEYIKKGDIMMLSEGKATNGTLFTLREGVLTMFVGKETYERAGLVGKPYGAKGGRGSKPRWAPSPDPLQKFLPTAFTSTPNVSRDLAVLQPGLDVDPEVLSENDRQSLEYFATEIHEWISLIRLGSSRVEPRDNIDPYLSRYSVPGDDTQEAKVCKLSWEGFMSAQWLRGLLMDVLVACPSGTWFSLSATCFSRSLSGKSDDLTILRPPNAAGRYLMWEIKSSD
ncbi:ribonuclease P MRP subunit POP1 [Fusarium beomiforme]|uniref:Ribonuclease P MRP subunit POP1 n=1 Tax=Fusarium beomiforme TaxID=44412 RepID=A0A9P5E0F9_9HYPO|nr:ribonuclease P MRP subunit POP1 [Fusarium beomiforme]